MTAHKAGARHKADDAWSERQRSVLKLVFCCRAMRRLAASSFAGRGDGYLEDVQMLSPLFMWYDSYHCHAYRISAPNMMREFGLRLVIGL